MQCKAQVSWKRIKPLLTKQEEIPKSEKNVSGILENGKVERQENMSAKQAEETLSQKELSQLEIAQSEIRCRKHKTITGPSSEFCLSGRETDSEGYFLQGWWQIIGITGPVACGKSTLGKVFLCEYPYEGQILVDGKELQNMPQSWQTNIIGYLGHDPELFNDSVENNVLMGEQKKTEDFLKMVCMAEEVNEMDDGLQTLVGNGGVRLSGGQGKRLALARTLCHKKPVLVLDDPFSALDKSTERQIFANLKAQAKENIVLLISHRLYLFPQMDQIIWMEDGKTVVGTHEELLVKVPEYKKLFTEEGGAESEDRQK